MKVGEPKRLLAGMLFLVLIAGVATPAFAMPPSDAVIVSTPAAVFTFTFPDALEPPVPALLPLGPPFGPTPLPPMPGTNQIIVFNEPANEGGGISDILVQTTNLNVCSTGICFVSDD